MRLVLLGLPGAGKGTQARLLVQRLGLVYIGTGEILRDAISRGTETGKLAKPLIDQGRLVPDKVVNDLVKDLLGAVGRPERFVTDGYPRTIAQAIEFEKFLDTEGLPLTAVVNLTISDDEVVARLLARRRDDDTVEAIRQRVEEFHKNNDAMVAFYQSRGLLRNVPAVGTVEEVHASILQALGIPAPT